MVTKKEIYEKIQERKFLEERRDEIMSHPRTEEEEENDCWIEARTDDIESEICEIQAEIDEMIWEYNEQVRKRKTKGE